METVININKPTIDSKLLINLSKSGRLVLAYIIDKQRGGNDLIKLNLLDVSNYLTENISSKDGSPWTVQRGIKDLRDNGVLFKFDTHPIDYYKLNLDLISK